MFIPDPEACRAKNGADGPSSPKHSTPHKIDEVLIDAYFCHPCIKHISNGDQVRRVGIIKYHFIPVYFTILFNHFFKLMTQKSWFFLVEGAFKKESDIMICLRELLIARITRAIRIVIILISFSTHFCEYFLGGSISFVILSINFHYHILHIIQPDDIWFRGN